MTFSDFGRERPRAVVTLSSSGTETAIEAHLLSLEVTDAAGIETDAFDLLIRAEARDVLLPEHGAEVDVYLGYEIDSRGLKHRGKFQVNECSLTFPPRRISVQGTAAKWDPEKQFKSPREYSWDDVTLGDILSEIANRNGLIPLIADEFRDKKVDHIDQKESDVAFITKLAERYGAIGKPTNDVLFFKRRYEGSTPEGDLNIPMDFMRTHKILNGSFRGAQRGSYRGVIAYYIHDDTGQRRAAYAGGEPYYKILDREFADAEEAATMANSKLQDFKYQTSHLELTMWGDPYVVAGAKTTITNLDPDIDGEWVIHKVIHSYSGAGYHTRLDCESARE